MRALVRRLIVTALAGVALVPGPLTAVLHGVAHQREAAAYGAEIAASGAAAAGHRASSVSERDADDHPVLHVALVGAQSASVAPTAPDVPRTVWPDVPLVRETVFGREALLRPSAASPPPDQPRAPPLG